MLLSYLDNEEVKAKYMKRMTDHIEADELVRNVGFERGRGCFIGCLFNDYDISKGETKIGFPEWLMHLLDVLHENTSEKYKTTLAPRVLEIVKPGKNLEIIKPKLMLFILEIDREIVERLIIPEKLKEKVLTAIEGVCKLWTIKSMSESAARSAARSAESAARSAESARSATWNAWSAESAARSAESAARSAESARSATWNARSAAESARSAAESARTRSAKNIVFDKIAEKTIELLGNL